MDSLLSESSAAVAPEIPTGRPRKVWKFWGTTLWGLFLAAATVAGQLAVIPAWFVWHWTVPRDLADVLHVASGSLMVSLSVIVALPAVLAALWIAIRLTDTPFAEYLALRWTSWRLFLLGLGGMVAIALAWGLLSRTIGREMAPDAMAEIMQSAHNDGTLWLMVIALGIGAPATEEFLARGFLYRGWSESFLGPAGAILLTSLVWAAVHMQYDWYLRGEVFCIGILLGYLRYRSNSILLTILLHGLNNTTAVLVTILFPDIA